MKLRLQSDSIRFRLKRGEVDHLAKVGRMEEQVVMGTGAENTFHYVLEASPTASSFQVQLRSNGIWIQVPAKIVSHWARGEEVGMEATLPLKDGAKLQVLIEKDFACLNGPEEENFDTFPNPLAGTKC
jgi:hypothetical protein